MQALMDPAAVAILLMQRMVLRHTHLLGPGFHPDIWVCSSIALGVLRKCPTARTICEATTPSAPSLDDIVINAVQMQHSVCDSKATALIGQPIKMTCPDRKVHMSNGTF